MNLDYLVGFVSQVKMNETAVQISERQLEDDVSCLISAQMDPCCVIINSSELSACFIHAAAVVRRHVKYVQQ